MQMIKIRDMKPHPYNLKVREADAPPEKNGSLNKKVLEQIAYFDRVIMRGKKLEDVDPSQPDVLRYNPRSSFVGEMVGGYFQPLEGEHRRYWFQSKADALFNLATAIEQSKDEPERAARIAADLRAKANAWLDFRIPCVVNTYASDAARAQAIAEGNITDEDPASRIKQSDEARYAAHYERAPVPKYLFSFSGSKVKGDPDRDAVEPDDVRAEGWTATECLTETGIGTQARTTYAALFRLGKHFELPLDFFMQGNRLKIKPLITPALLCKTTRLGEGKNGTDKYGYGLEPEYQLARAKAARQNNPAKALREAFDTYKALFLELMDEKGNGANALGNTPKASKEDKEAQKEADKRAEKEEADRKIIVRAGTMKYVFEQQAVKRCFGLEKDVNPTIGNALDLIATSISPERLVEASKALAEWKANDNAETAQQAITALVSALAAFTGYESSTLRTRTAELKAAQEEAEALKAQLEEQRAFAASAKPNTKKK